MVHRLWGVLVTDLQVVAMYLRPASWALIAVHHQALARCSFANSLVNPTKCGSVMYTCLLSST